MDALGVCGKLEVVDAVKVVVQTAADALVMVLLVVRAAACSSSGGRWARSGVLCVDDFGCWDAGTLGRWDAIGGQGCST
jgi:hypothetical protein